MAFASSYQYFSFNLNVFHSLVYIYNIDTMEYDFYQVFSISEDGTTCDVKKILVQKEILPWLGYFSVDLNTVGVYRYQLLDNDMQSLQIADLHGKALRVLNYIVSIPLNVLLEAT